MGIHSFELSPEQRQYFTDVDNSILHHSVELGKIELQAESLKSTLGTLYQARMKHMNSVLEKAGFASPDCSGARVEGGTVVVQVADPSAPST